jgi:hypothetical protein
MMCPLRLDPLHGGTHSLLYFIYILAFLHFHYLDFEMLHSDVFNVCLFPTVVSLRGKMFLKSTEESSSHHIQMQEDKPTPLSTSLFVMKSIIDETSRIGFLQKLDIVIKKSMNMKWPTSV